VVALVMVLVALGLVLAVLFSPVLIIWQRERWKRGMEQWRKELERWR